MRRIPNNDKAGAELVELFRRHLELCKVEKGQTVLVFTDSMMNPAYSAAVFGACDIIGADVYQINVPSNGKYIESRGIIEAWKSADLVLGMVATVPWLYSDAHNEALDAGVKTLMIQEPEDILRRLFPCETTRRRSVEGKRILEEGKKLHITSDAGTNLSLCKTGRPANAQYGYTDTPGRWDHWPSGLVCTAPLEESAEGTLVIDVGDILIDLWRYVSSPIRCDFREGKIINIEGGVDAQLLHDYFAAAKDEKAYYVSHIGWGTEDRAQWNAIGLRYWEWGGSMDAESYYGNMQIAFGTNNFRQVGGKTKCNFHIDIPTRNHSFWVDDIQVLDRGRFLLPELI
jgi:2,5-dihydroxypyridine 5,6-dioxygenase